MAHYGRVPGIFDGTYAVQEGCLIDGPHDDLTGGPGYRSGYWVGLTNNAISYDEQIRLQKVDTTIEQLIDDGHKLIGVWYDIESDHTFIDGIAHIAELAEAESLGRKHGQKAIYDISKRETVYL